jgi:hypothetical protein
MSETPQENHDLPSAEDLDHVAEEETVVAATHDATVNFVNNICISCDRPAIRICTHCGQEYCAQHYCITHEMSSERVPLTDEDGTEHRGYRIRLIGEGWPNHLLLIKDLNDSELDARISDLQKTLTQVIRTQDYTQISLAAHEYERDYRRHSRYVAAIKRREKIQQGSVRLNNKKHRVDVKQSSIPADIAALMKLGSLSYEQAIAMKAMLGKAKP